MLRAIAALFVLLFLQTPIFAQEPQVMTDAEITALLKTRVEEQKRGVGLVVGIVENGQERVIAYGKLGVDDPRPVDGNTVFELGSITKVFTGLLLADAVRRAEVRLDQPVAELLPPGSKVPSRNGRQITLFDLTTHTSGLPRLPDNFAPANWADPYADYTEDKLLTFLASYELPRDIGAKHEYSNFAVGLLGYALARAADTDYATLLKTRILDPLGMTDTAIALSDEQKSRFAKGYADGLIETPPWEWDVLAGAGALRSTANDMLKFLSAAMDPASPIGPLMQEATAQLRPAEGGVEVGLGWMVVNAPDQQFIFHSGGTGGYRAFMGFRSELKQAVVVLSNLASIVATDDIGFHLLDASIPLAEPPKERVAITLPVDKLDAVTGTYQFNPNLIMEVRREGDKLIAQATAQIAVEIFPESETSFFYTIVDAQLEFRIGADGKADQVTLYQAGQVLPAPRVK